MARPDARSASRRKPFNAMNLIVGATGLVGGDICRRLTAQSETGARVGAANRRCLSYRRAARLGRRTGDGRPERPRFHPSRLRRRDGGALHGVLGTLAPAGRYHRWRGSRRTVAIDRGGQSRWRETFRVSFVSAHPRGFRLAARQTRSGAGADRERHDLHHSAPGLLHGGLAQSRR